MSGPFGSSSFNHLVSTGFYNNVVNQSARFNDDDSAYLNRTITSASTGDGRKKSTFSCWIKQCKLNSSTISHVLYNQGDDSGTNHYQIVLYQDDLYINDYDYGSSGSPGSDILLQTDRKFRDTTAWMNIIVRVDTTQSTASDRVRVYINGVQETSFSTATYPDEDADLHIMGQTTNSTGVNTAATFIGRYTNSHKSDLYMADINFCDGQSLGPSSFGETKDGIWIPKDTGGLTFGTNGFRLQFKQTGTGTASASTIGADTSGQTNHFTSNNMTASDSNMPDCPENNFCTLNPLSYTSIGSLSDGGLTLSTSTNNRAVHGTMSLPPSGKWYYEVHIDSVQSGGAIYYGWGTDTSLGYDEYATDKGIFFSSYNEQVLLDGSGQSGGYGSNGTDQGSNGDIYSVLLDVDNGRFYYAKNGTYFNSADPAAGTGGLDVSATLAAADTRVTPCLTRGGSYNETYSVNFGQDTKDVSSANSDDNGIGTFEYAPPSGFLALCSANLPAVTTGPEQDTQGDDHFNTVLYTGTGAAQSITGVGFQPDWLWIKSRSHANPHEFIDSVRGVTKRLRPATGNAEETKADGDGFSTIDSNGFTLNDDGGGGQVNGSTRTYVAWNWKLGGAPSADNSAGAGAVPTANSVKIDGSNLGSTLAGSIPAKRLSANTTSGVSVVTYTGTGSAGTVAHGLGAVPKFYIVKNRTDASTNWQSYHAEVASDAETDYLYFNTSATVDDSDDWNDTAPTSSVFSVKSHNQVNASNDEYVAYVFAEIEGFSRIGQHEGNSNAEGTFVHLGFRPSWVMIKNIDAAGSWIIFDNKREGYNINNHHLMADTSAIEADDTDIDLLSNGFKCRRSSTSFNSNGHTFVYLAFAEQPYKFSNAR